MSTQIPVFPLTVVQSLPDMYISISALHHSLSSHRGDKRRRCGGGGGGDGRAGSAEGLACQSQAEMLSLEACSTSVSREWDTSPLPTY